MTKLIENSINEIVHIENPIPIPQPYELELESVNIINPIKNDNTNPANEYVNFLLYLYTIINSEIPNINPGINDGLKITKIPEIIAMNKLII